MDAAQFRHPGPAAPRRCFTPNLTTKTSGMSQTSAAKTSSLSPTASTGGVVAFVIWSLSALAFGYAFFQRVAPSVMVPDLMAEFAVSGAVLGQLSALYFYPYAALQLPIGALLDRYGARAMLAGAVSLAAAGSVLFGLAQSLEQAYAGRFLIGTGSAVGFIGSLALAARWFPARQFAFLTGFSMFFAMMCGIGGQAPLAGAVEAIGWRGTMIWSGVFAAALAVVIALVVRNQPPQAGAAAAPRPWRDIAHGLSAAVRSAEVWRIGLLAMAMSGPMLAFGGLWGVSYLATAYDLSRPEAAFYASLTLLGWAAGAPLSGWLSDRIGRRKLPLVAGTAVNTGCLCLLALAPDLPLGVVAVLVFVTGASGACMVLTFALAREVTQRSIHGSVSGLINGLTVGAGAVLQPVIGALLDLNWDGTMDNGARVYAAADYRFAFLSLAGWAAMGLVLSFTLRETRCRPVPVLR